MINSPVYEYPLNGQWIMMDIDDGYILWTGIWKGQSVPPFFLLPAWRRARARAVVLTVFFAPAPYSAGELERCVVLATAA